ncbi:MAG: hypothetical protein E7529_01495 [Ruminococcaceae bacterium]|nr:hypothetical protein [Oscillospiraceae bacterium]
MKKKIIPLIIVSVIIVGVILFTIANNNASISLLETNNPCEYCSNETALRITMSDGSNFYVCRKCTKNCFWCDNEATTHYENLLGMPMFVCSECYPN